MATLYVTEYLGARAPGPIAPADPLAEQTVTYTTSAASSAFNASTTVVRLVSKTDAYIAFGTNPTATASSMLLPAGVVEYFRVEQSSSYKVAAYDGSS